MTRRLGNLARCWIAAAVLFGPWSQAFAHICCYSSFDSMSTYPACYYCHCTYMQDTYRHWQEWHPVTTDEPHDHYWAQGVYLIGTTGPHTYPNCEGP